MARFSSAGVVMRYVLSVYALRHICSQAKIPEAQCTRGLGLGYVRSNTSCRPTDARDYFSGV